MTGELKMRRPVNSARLLERIARISRTHERRDYIAFAFFPSPQRASAYLALLADDLEEKWGNAEWWTDAQIGDWLIAGADLLYEDTNSKKDRAQ